MALLVIAVLFSVHINAFGTTRSGSHSDTSTSAPRSATKMHSDGGSKDAKSTATLDAESIALSLRKPSDSEDPLPAVAWALAGETQGAPLSLS